MHRRGLLGIVLSSVAMAVGGCFCFDFDFFPPPENTLDGGVTHDSEKPRPECLLEETFDLTQVLDAGAPPEGTSEVALSDAGCWSFRRTVVGGVLKEVQLRHVTGRFVVEQDGGAWWAHNVVRNPVTLTYGPDSLEGRFDEDEDGFFEGTLDETYAGERLVSSVRTSLDAQGLELERYEVRSLGNGQVHVTRASLINGLMQVNEDFDAPELQLQTAACYANAANTSGPGENPYDCSPEKLMQLQEHLLPALKTMYDCLSTLKGPLADRVTLLNYLLGADRGALPVRCFSSKRAFAAMDIAARTPVLYVNVAMLGCDESSFIESSLAHEFLHISRRAHNPTLERLYQNGTITEQQLQMADSIYGCEALCNPSPTLNRCSCARCLRTKACDDRCADLDSCVVRNPNPDGGAAIAITSEAVGALCEGNWYRSMLECQSGCGSPSSCKSLSVSCDDSCQ